VSIVGVGVGVSVGVVELSQLWVAAFEMVVLRYDTAVVLSRGNDVVLRNGALVMLGLRAEVEIFSQRLVVVLDRRLVAVAFNQRAVALAVRTDVLCKREAVVLLNTELVVADAFRHGAEVGK
jgi:hypothetical protein